MPRQFIPALLASIISIAGAQPLPFTEGQAKKLGTAEIQWIANPSGGPGAARVKFDDPGDQSGLKITPPEGQKFWDLTKGKILAVDVENLSPDKQLRLTVHIASGFWQKKTEKKVESAIALNPGEKRTLNLLIPHSTIYHAPDGVPGAKVVESDKINSIDLYMPWPFEGKRPGLADFRISNVRLEGTPDTASTVHPESYFPFIDIYGQYIHTDWPEKIHTDEDLKKARAAEQAELDASKRPTHWNKFGGWADGPQLKATGSFRTEKYQGKWWLVDPEGKLFFSQGIDVLHAQTDATLSKDHQKWFGFPVTTDELTFNDWNLRKKYGTEDYQAAYYATLSQRLEHWGMNSIGNWGKSDLIALGRTPYTLQLADYNERLPRISGSKLKFYDVFDPGYISAMKNLVARASSRNPSIARSLTDPMCIGYFIDNELNYGNRGRQTLVDDVLRSPAKQASKLEFIKDLKAKYGDIAKLNTAWETSLTDWDALLNGSEVPKSKGYKEDSDAFFLKTVDQYFRLCRDAVKTAAPDRLYLGSRFISTDAIRQVLADASKKYCDILTVNVYAPNVANFGTATFPDMPVLIGEFHLGVRDRGMFSPSSVPTGVTQAERALAYTRFLQGALVHPNIVGTHWFQYRDQPLTGRWDGEGYCIGFVDVADTPYKELIKATREVGENMYGYRLRGKLPSTMK